MAENVRPTIGRIVDYTNIADPPAIHAALVTGVYGPDRNWAVDLAVFYREGMYWRLGVEFSHNPAGAKESAGKWAWPRRV